PGEGIAPPGCGARWACRGLAGGGLRWRLEGPAAWMTYTAVPGSVSRGLSPLVGGWADKEPPMPIASGTPRPTVLVVDDNASIRTVVADILTQGGFDVVEAGGRESALEACRERAPAL